MRIKTKYAQPKLTLYDLLRRRKTTFAAWLPGSNVSTYAELVRWCHSVGVLPPDEAAWDAQHPSPVTSQADGVIVLADSPFKYVASDSSPPKKSPRKKKEDLPVE